MDIQGISDRLELGELPARHVRAVDGGDRALLDTVFTADAIAPYARRPAQPGSGAGAVLAHARLSGPAGTGQSVSAAVSMVSPHGSGSSIGRPRATSVSCS
ncbi:nuclear transport factor 2 family protein [Actinoallomurus spadix]|uniref:SnoaL-like domain-containing protein n=1 Tax=Actinoallomurus spadix TaxID=79912 RepID=A0ABP3GRZ2_9ACTN